MRLLPEVMLFFASHSIALRFFSFQVIVLHYVCFVSHLFSCETDGMLLRQPNQLSLLFLIHKEPGHHTLLDLRLAAVMPRIISSAVLCFPGQYSHKRVFCLISGTRLFAHSSESVKWLSPSSSDAVDIKVQSWPFKLEKWRCYQSSRSAIGFLSSSRAWVFMTSCWVQSSLHQVTCQLLR